MLRERADRRRPLVMAIFTAISAVVGGGLIAVANVPGTKPWDDPGNSGLYAFGFALASVGPLALILGAILEVPERMADLLHARDYEAHLAKTLPPKAKAPLSQSGAQIEIPRDLRIELLRRHSVITVDSAAAVARGSKPSNLAAVMYGVCADIDAGVDPVEAWRRAVSLDGGGVS